MQEELFEILDKNGNVVDQRSRSEVHSKGLRHKGIYLLLFDVGGRILLQKRSAGKDLAPGKWDFSVAEHLQPQESYENACLRGAAEELGVKVRNLKLLGEIDYYFKYPGGKIDNELNHFFVGEFEGKIRFGDGEVEEGRFVELGQLLKEMEEDKEKFTPWLLNCRKCLEKLAAK